MQFCEGLGWAKIFDEAATNLHKIGKKFCH